MIMEEMSFKSIDLCPQTMILLPDPCYQQFRITYPAMTVSLLLQRGVVSKTIERRRCGYKYMLLKVLTTHLSDKNCPFPLYSFYHDEYFPA